MVPFRRPDDGPDIGRVSALRPWNASVGAPAPAPIRPGPRLLDRVSAAIRTRHLSPRTEAAYVAWIRQFIVFHGKRHPDDMGEPEISAFLNMLAVDRHVSASTQNQALAGLLFLYREVLGRKIDWLKDVVHAKRPDRVPVVLIRSEVAAVLAKHEPSAETRYLQWRADSPVLTTPTFLDLAYW